MEAIASSAGCIPINTTATAWIHMGSCIGLSCYTSGVKFTVDANPNSAFRAGTISIGGVTVTVVQDGAQGGAGATCGATLSAIGAGAQAFGMAGTVNVTAAAGCTWTVSVTDSWVQAGLPSWSGSGIVSFGVLPNTGMNSRISVITIAGLPYTIAQAGTAGGAPATGLTFVPLTPCRVLETRVAYNFQGRTGAFGPPALTGGETRTLPMYSSNVCNIPSSAKAFVVNVTLVPTHGVSFVTLWPDGDPQPNVWTIRSPDGRIVANSAIVKAGASGGISVYASDNTDVLIDIAGYFTDNVGISNLVYYPLAPCRVIDTRLDYRSPAGPFGPPSMRTDETRRFRLPASPYCTVPANATVYSMTVTAVPQGPLQFLTIWADGSPRPNVSSINSPSARVLANSVIIPANSDGSIDIYAYNATDFLIDINGYFAPDDGATGQYYFPVTQCRASDSTVSGGLYPDDSARTIFIPTAGACLGIPFNAKAYAINVTVLPSGSAMPFLTVYATGQARPNTSILNAFEGQTVTNSAIVPAATGGTIDVYAYRHTNVVVEISGYFGR